MEGMFLRSRLKDLGFEQANVAEKLGISPQAFNSKLNASDLKFSFIKKVAQAINKSFYELIEEPFPSTAENPYLRAPQVITVDSQQNDNVALVPVKAQAGYLTGYNDPEFIQSLPTYRLPNIQNGIFRMFQVKGFSMYPTLQNNSYVVGQFVEDIFNDIKDNRVYVVVTKENGVIIKRVLNRLEKYGNLYCKSDNRREYPNLPIIPEDINEVWECKMQISFEFLDPIDTYTKISDIEADVEMLKNHLNIKNK